MTEVLTTKELRRKGLLSINLIDEIPVPEGPLDPLPPPAIGDPLRILWVFGTVGYMRHFRTVIEAQLLAGHYVHCLYEGINDAAQYIDDQNAVSAYPNFKSEGMSKKFIKEIDDEHLLQIRASWDYLRYFHPTFKNADYLRSRTEEDVPEWVLRLGRTGVFRFGPLRRAAEKMVERLERKRAADPRLVQYVRALNPDVVMISPLIRFASRQTDFVKAAAQLGIPSALGVASWDNLSNKGAIRIIPDKVIVWNDIQIDEAVDFHGVRREQCVATGAQTFDPWFDRSPSTDRAAFCRGHALDWKKKLIVYLCSSGSIGGHERSFIEVWLQAVREAGSPELEDAEILIRPHPKNRGQWDGCGGQLDGVPISPLDDAGFYGPSGQNNLFDTLYHADVLVGLNTTAMIEAAILRKPVLTPQLSHMPEVRRATEEMYHFRYLSEETGGFVRVGHTMEEHLAQVEDALARPQTYHGAADSFIASFVRPKGRSLPALDILEEAIEDMARASRARRLARR